MDFKDLIVRSWQNTLNHIGPLLLITLVQLVLIIITFGILAPVTTAGYVHSLMQVVRDDRKPEVGDLFSQMRLFLPLFVLSILAALVAFIGFSLLILPGFAVLAFIAFAAFYLLPYMVDQKLGLFDALKASWEAALKEPVSEHIIVVIIYVAIMSLGSSLWFAFLITQPMATFIMVEAYNRRVLGNRYEDQGTFDGNDRPSSPVDDDGDEDQGTLDDNDRPTSPVDDNRDEDQTTLDDNDDPSSPADEGEDKQAH